MITENKGMANTINDFYTNIGSSVEAKIPQSQNTFHSYLGNFIFNSFNPSVISTDEIAKIVDLNISKACGPFSFPSKIIKEFSDILLSILTIVIDKSIREGVFPELLKKALVCPIYKKNDKGLYLTSQIKGPNNNDNQL